MSQFLKQAQEFVAKKPDIAAKELSELLAQCPPVRGASGYRRLQQCYAAGLVLKKTKKDLDGKPVLNKTLEKIEVIKQAIANFSERERYKREYPAAASFRKLNKLIKAINPEFEAESAASLAEILKNYKIKF